ncbi:hypothetical protein CBD41_02200 [bacterium TMED181]|nr:MAG: hypothetical protein CBD41_02200 [bacterium TMED181]
MKPKIGLNVDVAIEDSGRIVTRMNIRYSDLILRHGGIPVIFPPGIHPEEVLELVDGFLLIGGDDYRCSLSAGSEAPPRYVEVLPRREEADLAWARSLLDSDIPVLGICGGLQALCLVAGGNLYGDIETETESDVVHRIIEKGVIPRHEVHWHGGLEDAPGPGSFLVNSSHHQSVRDLPEHWKLLAESSDGIIEACSDETGRCIGIQWHPELMEEDQLGHAVVERMIQNASQRQGERLA